MSIFSTKAKGGHTAFGAIGICVASCLHSITWTNGWILTKLAQTHYWEGGKKCSDFGDRDLIFKVTPALWNFLVLNQMTDSGQTSYILGWFKDLIRFWWLWSNFQGHHTIKTVTVSLVCTLFPEPIDGCLLNLQRNTIGTGSAVAQW